jgi:hypothetical protein
VTSADEIHDLRGNEGFRGRWKLPANNRNTHFSQTIPNTRRTRWRLAGASNKPLL